MAAETTTRAFGWRVLGLGVIALAVVGLGTGDFLPGQTVPKAFPERQVLAYAAAALMLVAGAAMTWRRTVVWAAGALTIYFGLLVVVLMDARLIVAHYGLYLAYSNVAEQLAIAASALIAWAAHAKFDAARAARLTRLGQMAFGVCATLFGGAHFFYMNLTAPLVPKWLPPGQVFWGYATGVLAIMAGLAILSGVTARLAAVLLTVMYVGFQVLVHLPMLIDDPTNHGVWTENATNLVLVGAAWVVADSLARRAR